MNQLQRRPFISQQIRDQQQGSLLKQIQLKTNLLKVSNKINIQNDVQQQKIIYHYSIKITPSSLQVKQLLSHARNELQKIYGKCFISNKQIYSFIRVEETQKIYIQLKGILYSLNIYYKRQIALNLNESNQDKNFEKNVSSLAIQGITAIYKAIQQQFQKDILKQTELSSIICKGLDHFNFQCLFREQIGYRVNLNEEILNDEHIINLLQDINNLKKIQDVIIGKYVRMKYQLNRLYQIQRIDFSKNPLSTFYSQEHKQQITFQRYYKEKYNLDIKYLNQPLFVHIKKYPIQLRNQEIYLIPEFCQIFFQLKPQKANKTKQIQVSLRQKIYQLKLLQKFQSETGIQIKQESYSVKAYVLNPPKLIFQNDKKEIQLRNNKTHFSISNQLINNINFKEWIFIYPKDDANMCFQLSKYIQQQGQRLGISIFQPMMIQINKADLSDGIALLEKYFQKNQVPQFILSYVNYDHPRQQTFYQALKLYLYATVGIEHQHFNKDFSCHKDRNTIITSLLCQIASKLGYLLWQTCIPDQIYNKTMIIAITNSINKYVINTKHLPDNIIIYRQGLIERFLQIEKESIQNGFKLFKEGQQPKFAYFCVSKSKKQQFFYQKLEILQPNYQDQKMRIAATVIPAQHNNQVKFEFFICSMNIQDGLNIPTRYTCLYDDTSITQEQHWIFTYYQCFNYLNFQGASKIPAQLKYACKLLKFRKKIMEIDPQDQEEMRKLIIRLIITVSLPIIIGVAIVLSTFYILLWKALGQLEQQNSVWIGQTQQQILYNSVFSQQILQEYSFNQLEVHIVVIKSLLKKFDSQQIKCKFNFIFKNQLFIHLSKENYDSTFSICSFREFTFNQCPQQIYNQLKQNLFYGDLYFVRSVFKFNLLTPQQQYFIQMVNNNQLKYIFILFTLQQNDHISFYARAAFVASQSKGIIQLNYIYNSDTTSVLTGVPSQPFNYTDSDYQSCYGNNFVEPYDPRCRGWYQFAQQNQGIFIYEPYQDAIVGNLMMTVSSQVEKDNAFYSVQSIDFLLQNLISLFNSNLSLKSYPVLIHEFDARVLYHPIQVFYQTISWPDIEFFNIKQLCSKNNEDFELCLSQKQKFSKQVNQTLEFIKTGNYSIQKQTNLKGLYQYWQRFGQKQISLIFPVQSKLRGLNNQKPYSYAIILTGKVIIDNSDQFKMFNLLDVNVIRIPLIVEFISPIQILILFLQRSQMQQIYSQQQSNTPTVKQNHLVQKKKFEDKNTQIQLLLNENQNQESITNFGFNLTQYYVVDKILDENQRCTANSQQQANKSNLEDFNTNNENTFQNYTSKANFSNSKQNEQLTQINQIQNNQIAEDSFENQLYQSPQNNQSVSVLKNNRLTMQSDYITQLENVQQKNKEEDKSKILQGLKPLFLEMKIIKNVFQNLERVINYQIDAQNQNSQDTINSLFHFAKAKTTFQNINNLTGLSRCYFNLGLIYLLKNEYSLASEYFESSIQQGIEVIGIDYENLLNQKIIKSEESTQNYILILSKRIFSLAYCLKQQGFQKIYFFNYQNEKENLQNQCEYQSYCQDNLTQHQTLQQLLLKSLNLFYMVQKIVQNSFECFSYIFKIYLYQEIVEVLIHLNQNDKIQKYFYKIEEIFQLQSEYPKQIDGPYKKTSFSKFIQNSYKSLYQKSQTDQIFQIKELLKCRQYFLQGLREKTNQNYITAILNFTRSIEEGIHYNPLLRKKALYQINELFSNFKLQQVNVEQKYLKYEENVQIDLIILLQLEFQLQYSTFETCIEKIKKSNFLRSQDRIKIIVYHSDLDVYIPFTIVNDDQIWKIITDTLKNITRNITQDQKLCKNQLSWQQALFFCLGQHQEYNKEDLMYLKQIQQFNRSQDQNSQSYSKEKIQNKLEQKQYRKKIILLFSKQQQNKDLKQKVKRTIQIKVFNQVKPIVYHFKEYSDPDYEKQKFQTKHFNYESFLDENLLITKLTQQRDLLNFNNQNEFLTILNNS
ncbi:hypothetical protein ABPG74_019617 [Tetrahymena malaccensis]